MTRGFVAFALMFATFAMAADAGQPKNKPPATQQKKQAPAPAVDPELRRAKVAFMAAVGACARPGQCDPSSRNSDKDAIELLKSTEERFIDACRSCASAEACDKEASRIRDGKQSFGNVPCQPLKTSKK